MLQEWEQGEINAASMGAERDKCRKRRSRERKMPQVWEQQREINSAIVGAERDKCRRCGSR